MLSNSEELQLYLKSLEILHGHRRLYWRRFTAFLALQTLLFTAASLAQNRLEVLVVLAIFGMVFSAIWLVVMYYGDMNIQNWEYVLAALEWDNEALGGNRLMELKIEAPEPDPRVPIPRWLKDRSFMIEQYLPVLTGVLWLLFPTLILVSEFL